MSLARTRLALQIALVVGAYFRAPVGEAVVDGPLLARRTTLCLDPA